MLIIFSLSNGERTQITCLKQLDDMLHGYVLDKFQEMTLMRMMRDDKEHVFAENEAKRLVMKVTKKTLGSKLDPGERDERGNLRLSTAHETDISVNPFFNENYALNELHKLMRRAIQDGVLEPSFKSTKLTYHDVPTGQRGQWMNVRAFTGEIMYPRITKHYRYHHRVERKVFGLMFDQTTLSERDYLTFRRTFLEPTAPDQPVRRGRKEVNEDKDVDFSLPGIMSPETEKQVGLKPLEVPKPLERNQPGKVLFVAPSKGETQLVNNAEDTRRERDFPFGAGPSGSMAYDMAVYRYYLRHWKKLDPEDGLGRDMMRMFGISRAIGYVKYGHHSFYEALITLADYFDKEVFNTPESLYAYILTFVELGFREPAPKYSTEKTYEHVDALTVHWDSYLGDWLDWRAYNPENYRPWTISCLDGVPVGRSHEPIPAGKYIYVILVLDRSVRYLPTSPEGEQYRSHSQLAGGLSVLAAGYFKIGQDEGFDLDGKPKLKWIDNSSGHYKPSRESVDYAKKRFGKLGFDVSETECRKFTPTAGDNALLPYIKQQTITDLRILKGWVKKTPGRTRSFPDPPQDLLPYMPY